MFVSVNAYLIKEGSQKKTHVSLEDTAVTLMQSAALNRKINLPASVLLVLMGMDAYAMVWL